MKQTTMAGSRKDNYRQSVMRIFGSSLIAYYPLWEASGTVAADIKGGHNGTYTIPFLNQPGAGDGRTGIFIKAESVVNILSAGLSTAFGNGQTGTVWITAKIPLWTNFRSYTLFKLANGGGNMIYIRHTTTANQLAFLYYANATLNLLTDTSLAGSNDTFDCALTWSKADDRVRCYINGAQVGADMNTVGTWSAAGLDNAVIGAEKAVSPEECFDGFESGFMLGNQELTATQILALHNLRLGLLTKNIVFEGDSLTLGNTLADYDAIGLVSPTAYPTQVVAGLAGCDWWNFAFGGETIQTMLTQTATIDAKYDATKFNAAVLWAGTNDYPDRTAAQIVGDLTTWITGRKAAGFKTILIGMISYTPTGHGGYETKWKDVNTALRADPTMAGNLDKFIDLATLEPTILGADAAYQDTTYYNADGVHLNATGYAIVANYVRDALL